MAKGNDVALSAKIDTKKIVVLQDRIDKNSELIDSIVNKLVADYCKSSDDYMDFIRTVLSDPKNPPTDVELDDFTLNLPVLIYFTGEAQESLGVKEDIAKAIKQELFNDMYTISAGTVADKTASAELATQSEYLAHIAYQRAYKKVKLRTEAASEMLQSVKKVISRRMSEYELSRVDAGRVGGR